MAQGENNAAIAKSLFLTERAVEKHINSLFHKLDLTEEPDVHRRVMAVLAFLRETGEPDITVVPARRVDDVDAARRVAQHQVRHAVADAPPRALRAAVADHDRVGAPPRPRPRRSVRRGSPRSTRVRVATPGNRVDPREVRVGIGGASRVHHGAQVASGWT